MIKWSVSNLEPGFSRTSDPVTIDNTVWVFSAEHSTEEGLLIYAQEALMGAPATIVTEADEERATSQLAPSVSEYNSLTSRGRGSEPMLLGKERL